MFRAVELLGHEPSIPGQDRVWLSHTSNLAERFASQPLSNFSQGDSFRVRKTQGRRQFGPQDSILSGQVFVPQKELGSRNLSRKPAVVTIYCSSC